MTSTTTERTLEVLSVLFAAHGLPEQIVSDNGSQFSSDEFEMSMKRNGIKHIHSAPGHPATYGEAERFVQTFKRALKTGKRDGHCRHDCHVVYRTTPRATTGFFPAELFVKCQLHTRLDLLHPVNQTKVNAQQAVQKDYYDQHSRYRQFETRQ